MNDEENLYSKEKFNDSLIHLYFIVILILITICLIILRILLYFFNISDLIQLSRDYDYRILIRGMDNGLINFYKPVPGGDWPPYYLYFWYFLFFPMYLIPLEIGVYIWDILRLVMCIYVIRGAPKIFESKIDLIIFYVLTTFSYSVDAYYNNCNFLIQFLLFNSYVSLEKDKKWLSGIFFTLAMFKINSILFLPILLIVKKIKIKDLIYYLVPFFLICIPYLIFPDYFMQMLTNWGHLEDHIRGITILDSIFWKALQPSHLMTISLLLLIFYENINSEKKKHQFRIIILPILIVYYMYLMFIAFVMSVFYYKFYSF